MNNTDFKDFLAFNSDIEENIFIEYMKPLEKYFFYNKDYIKNEFIKHNKLFYSEEAFKKMVSFLFSRLASVELKEIYNIAENTEEIDNNALEIIIDTMLDASIYRINKSNHNADDEDLYKLLKNYEDNIYKLYDFTTQIHDAFFDLYAKKNLTLIQKKNLLIAKIIPVIDLNIELFEDSLPEHKKVISEFFAILKNDLEQMILQSKSRFDNFFNDWEKRKIYKMQNEELLNHLATLAIENRSMLEAKRLGNILTESRLYLETLNKIMKSLKISSTDLKNSTNEKNKLDYFSIAGDDE